jgi:hypothetical protein
LFADPAVMLNAELVAPVSPEDVAERVYPVPDLLMLRPVKALTPDVAAPLAVPERVPADGFVPIARAMLAVDVVTVLPPAS